MFHSTQTSLSASAIQTDCLPTLNDSWHTRTHRKHTLKSKTLRCTDKQSHITRWHSVQSTPPPTQRSHFQQRLIITSMLHYKLVSHEKMNTFAHQYMKGTPHMLVLILATFKYLSLSLLLNPSVANQACTSGEATWVSHLTKFWKKNLRSLFCCHLFR